NDIGMAMAGRADRDAGVEIEEPVAVDVLDNGSGTAFSDQRIGTRVRRRDVLPVTFDDRARLRAGQFRYDFWQFIRSYLRLHLVPSRVSSIRMPRSVSSCLILSPNAKSLFFLASLRLRISSSIA